MTPGAVTTRWHLRASAGALAVLAAVVSLVLAIAPPVAAASESDTITARANAARADEGLAPLVRNPALDAAALDWAREMADDGRLSHNPDLSGAVPSGWQRIGENVAQGYGSGSAMHAGWMGSSGHRANILGDYTDIGVAFIREDGTTWGVQVFAKYPGSANRPAPVTPSAPRTTKPTTAKPTTAKKTTPSPRTPPRTTAVPTTEPSPSAATTATPTPTATTAPVTTTAPTDGAVAASGAEPPSSTAASGASSPVTTRVAASALGAAVVLGLGALLLGRRRRTAGATAGAGRHRG
ncbi:CAP domain-containing protein [Mumia zhuanghuii]|uniref:CAP domain-containing protein n=2 Tax=Mumia TaxID=1546255 RepID=A0ABW1QIW7_9ACTN|nr:MULTISPECIES: CAP domain-containing protein [Mumia]KAA1424766.1 CAP domain-containing protein [Mumia zhuanghuii]